MAATAAGAMAGGCDGLTEAILLEAEIAATRRLDWRMALENMAVVLKTCGRSGGKRYCQAQH
jgi:CDGSH-type Zn-finger protein